MFAGVRGEATLVRFAASNGKVAYATATTGKAIIAFDMATDTVKTTISLPDDPTGIAISKDDSTLFVTAGVVEGKLLVIDAKTGKVTKTIPVGHSPVAPVVTKDMKTVYLLVPLAPLAGAILAGLLGKKIGRSGAHWATILGVGFACLLSIGSNDNNLCNLF